MARGIQLRRYEILNANHYFLHGFRLKVDVAAVSGGMVPEIFIFLRQPPNPDTGEIVDEFQSLASFVDIAEWPVNAPDPSKGLAFFRKSWVELDLRSARDYEDTWNAFVSMANNLCLAMDKADVLVVAEEVWAGTVPDESSDSVSVSEP